MATQTVPTKTNSLEQVTCPKCKTTIKLTDALLGPILAGEKDRMEREANERVLNAQAEATSAAKRELDHQKYEAEKAQTELRLKLHDAQQVQARVLLKEMELETRTREIELTIARRVQTLSNGIQEEAVRTAQSEAALNLAERDQKIATLIGQIDEMKIKAQQGSQQSQGEVQEVVLETALRNHFRFDSIESVGKGISGADCLQRIINDSGRPCGSILWESKRTKTWSDPWIPKLRDDQRSAKADISILVTQTLPKGTDLFEWIGGVWVVRWDAAMPLAWAVRAGMIEVEQAKVAGEGAQTKAGMVYAYLLGPQFKSRIAAIVEKMTAMAEDLEAERRSTTRMWAKREQLLRGAVEAAAGMYGDLQGIAGKSLGELEGLGVGKRLES